MSELKVLTAKTHAAGFGADEIDGRASAIIHYDELFKMEEEEDTHPHDVQTLLSKVSSVYSGSAHQAIRSIVVTTLGGLSPKALPPQHYYSDVFQMALQPALAEGREHLQAALGELDRVAVEAREEGFKEPSDQAIGNARKLLADMLYQYAKPVEVFPTEERDVHIHAQAGFRRSVTVICESGGSALCLVNLNGRHRRAFYSSADQLPDGFLREGLAEIDGQ